MRTPCIKRQINQALFKRIEVEQDGDIHADLTEPFRTLLSPAVRNLATTSPAEQDGSEPDWRTWEDSFNDNTHEEDLVGAISRPRGRGLNYEVMVELIGFK